MRTEKLIAIVVSAQLLMAAAQPVRLQPSSQWVLDYAENSCRLIRNFGEGDQQTKTRSALRYFTTGVGMD